MIPVTTLVATVSNDFVRRLPDAHAPRGMNVKNRTRDLSARICVNKPKQLNRNALFNRIRVTQRDRDGGKQKALENSESHSEVCMFGVRTQQFPSTHNNLLKGHIRARDSTL